jgi:hypothetical protein
MEDLSLLIMVLQEKLEKDIINEYTIYYMETLYNEHECVMFIV